MCGGFNVWQQLTPTNGLLYHQNLQTEYNGLLATFKKNGYEALLSDSIINENSPAVIAARELQGQILALSNDMYEVENYFLSEILNDSIFDRQKNILSII